MFKSNYTTAYSEIKTLARNRLVAAVQKTVYWLNLFNVIFEQWLRSHFKWVSLFSEKVEVALSQASTYLNADIMESFCCYYEGCDFILATEHGLQSHTFVVHKRVWKIFIWNSFVHKEVQNDAMVQSSIRPRKRTRVNQEDMCLFNDDIQPLETRVSVISDECLEIAERSFAIPTQDNSSAEIDQTF